MFGGCVKCTSKARLEGMTAIVTGSNTGIGKFTAQDLYRRGCRVIMACRSVDKAEEAREDIQKELKNIEDKGTLLVKKLDVSSMKSVEEFARNFLMEEERLDILVNNAGIMMCPKTITEDGFELQFATNHLGHFLLTLLLLPRLMRSTPARIVNVSSLLHKGEIDFEDLNYDTKSYDASGAYSRSKLANILFTKELARRLEGKGVHAYALHPGVVDTEVSRHLSTTVVPGARWLYKNVLGLFLKSPEQGAQTTIYCCVDEKAGTESGLYYSDCKVEIPAPRAEDMVLARKLYDMSVVLTKVQDPLPQRDKPARSTVRLGTTVHEF